MEMSYLHGNQAVVHHDLLREEVGAYCGLVTRTELLVDL